MEYTILSVQPVLTSLNLVSLHIGRLKLIGFISRYVLVEKEKCLNDEMHIYSRVKKKKRIRNNYTGLVKPNRGGQGYAENRC